VLVRVSDLLDLEALRLSPLWATPELLGLEVSGVTATDLEAPGRYLHPGEAVLSGLVWWTAEHGQSKAERFVAQLRTAGASVLLAGVEHHGRVPAEVLQACRRQDLALVKVPAETSFRAVTDAVYQRQWQLPDLPAASALPAPVRDRIAAAGSLDAALEVLADHLGSPASVVTGIGRTHATSSRTARPDPRAVQRGLELESHLFQAIGSVESPYDAWFLKLPGVRENASRVLNETAELLAGHRDAFLARRRARIRVGDALVAVIESRKPSHSAVAAALAECGLVPARSYQVAVATAADHATAALEEALLRAGSEHFALADTAGGAIAVIEPGVEDGLRQAWGLISAAGPGPVLGLGRPTEAELLGASLVQAGFAASVAAAAAPESLTGISELRTLAQLLAGIPATVRETYHEQVLGHLADGNVFHTALRETLQVFLDLNGSWTRTAEALHLHVNTVHYRIEKVEQLTGRNLSSLADRLDLRSALLLG
jgi:hypothetical protein